MATGRTDKALSLQEEKHLLLGKAHSVLALACRMDSVEATREALHPVRDAHFKLQEDLDDMIKAASPAVLADKPTMLVVVSASGDALSYCNQELRSDPELVLAACREDGSFFNHASPELQADRGFVLQVVSSDGFALKRVSQDLKADPEIVWAAVQSQPLALAYASEELRRDRDWALAALRLQTRRNYLINGDNVFECVCEHFHSDRELALEAARAGVAMLESIHPTLRQDKDFLLEVLRVIPRDERANFYEEVDVTVQRTTSERKFMGAADSVLAIKGEAAPTLTIEVSSDVASSATNGDCRSKTPFSFYVNLMSGNSFTCSLSEDSDDEQHGDDDESEVSEDEWYDDESSRYLATWTVHRLAKLVHTRLSQHSQSKSPPAHIFLVFAKRDAEGEDESVPVTPWDWNRPVTDFC